MFYDRKDDIYFIRWAKEIKQRDHYTCQICGRRGVELNAHHKNSWNWAVDERYSLSNGITLCRYHHDAFHDKFGHGNNTEAQFKEFELICKILESVAVFNFKLERIINNIKEKIGSDEYHEDQKSVELVCHDQTKLDGYQESSQIFK